MITYHTSIRKRSIQETLKYAKIYANQYGITRVTNTTRLDNIGVPVYASIRPGAAQGSLCVSAGKGLTEEEAKVGAYMEALELTFTEPHRRKVPLFSTSITNILDEASRPNAILDFCPKVGVEIDLETPINGVNAIDLISGKTYVVPAELAFIPYLEKPIYFGSNSNGLASGNTLEEATLHGILEVIERDISSFQMVEKKVAIVSPKSYPAPLKIIAEKVKKAGHELVIRYGFNQFEMPYFIAYLVSGTLESQALFAGGYGCHFSKDIAIMRAATEAMQSRLSIIHGGRDDLVRQHNLLKDLTHKELYLLHQGYLNLARNESQIIDFQDIKEFNWSFNSIESYVNAIKDLLQKHGFNFVLRVAYTQREEPLQVVKIIIPKMEFFNSKSKKIGIRLRDYAAKIANHPLRGTITKP